MPEIYRNGPVFLDELTLELSGRVNENQRRQREFDERYREHTARKGAIESAIVQLQAKIAQVEKNLVELNAGTVPLQQKLTEIETTRARINRTFKEKNDLMTNRKISYGSYCTFCVERAEERVKVNEDNTKLAPLVMQYHRKVTELQMQRNSLNVKLAELFDKKIKCEENYPEIIREQTAIDLTDLELARETLEYSKVLETLVPPEE